MECYLDIKKEGDSLIYRKLMHTECIKPYEINHTKTKIPLVVSHKLALKTKPI